MMAAQELLEYVSTDIEKDANISKQIRTARGE